MGDFGLAPFVCLEGSPGDFSEELEVEKEEAELPIDGFEFLRLKRPILVQRLAGEECSRVERDTVRIGG